MIDVILTLAAVVLALHALSTLVDIVEKVRDLRTPAAGGEDLKDAIGFATEADDDDDRAAAEDDARQPYRPRMRT